MKALIIVFSPSGHTAKISSYLKSGLEANGVTNQLINITKNENYLYKKNIKTTLLKEVNKHDILFIGGPVYAGHVENHILQIIEELPLPNEQFSDIVVPFVTYGGVHSSIGLEEMGKLLRRKQRKSILGFKIASKHTLTQTFKKIINEHAPNQESYQVVDKALNRVMALLKGDIRDLKDNSKSFCYADAQERQLFNTFSQNHFHKDHKNVSIKQEKCIACRKCIKACPVNMFHFTGDQVKMSDDKTRCILCAECFHNCLANAIEFTYLDKVEKRLKQGYAKLEEPQSGIYPIVD